MYEIGHIADVIDIILFKYNYIDNRLFNLCKKYSHRVYDDGSIVVSTNTVHIIVEKFFEKESASASMMPSEQVYKSANTIYFINKLFIEMPNIKWVKMTQNKNRIYSRVVDQSDLGPVIKFTFKIIHGTIKLYEYFEEDEIKIFNKYVESLDLFKEKPYAHVETSLLLNHIETILQTNALDENAEILVAFLDLFDMKLESDNPALLLVTDY